MSTWQLQDAKAKLSALVKKAITQGPQEITLRGEPAVVVMSKAHYDQITGDPHLSLLKFIQRSPLKGINLKIKRDKSSSRNINLSED